MSGCGAIRVWGLGGLFFGCVIAPHGGGGEARHGPAAPQPWCTLDSQHSTSRRECEVVDRHTTGCGFGVDAGGGDGGPASLGADVDYP